jgi:mono/diheme cytochrome c family protein
VIEQYVSPAEFRRLVSALIVVLGFIAITIFFSFLIVPGLRYQARTAEESAVVAVQGEQGWLEATDYLPAQKREIPPIDPATVMTSTQELLARGKQLFAQNCSTCHGITGQGDGAGGKGLNPPPRNFTVSQGWKRGTNIEGIFGTLGQGIPGSAMVSYSYLSKKDRMALVHYVQSLGAYAHEPSNPEARAALERLFASAGEVIPNKIPVAAAMRKLAEERQEPEALQACLADPDFDLVFGDAQRAALAVAAARGAIDAASFARQVALGAPDNGFPVRINTYSVSQWNQLRLCIASH